MARPGTFYRGERSHGWIVTLIVSALVVMILLAIWLFYDLQQYIVYDKDGVQLVLPESRSGTQVSAAPDASGASAADLPLIDVEIVVEQADYSDIAGTDGGGLTAIRGRFVPAESVTQATLDYYATDMGGYDALVLELKTADGALHYHSHLALADSYDVNGTFDLQESVEKLRERDIWLVAQLSCLIDGTMAVRNSPIALKTAAGSLYINNGRAWLDPYSPVTRAYLTGMLEELADMGFDEVLLTDLWVPEDENLRYSSAMTAVPSAADAASSLALYLRGQADALGIRLSGTAERDAAQDLEVFFKAFDRVAFAADAYGYADELARLTDALGGDGDTRILPVAAGWRPEHASYVVK